MLELSDFAIRKFVAPEFIFGIDARFLAARYARNLGARKLLVVTDPGVEAAGWTGEVVEKLTEAGIAFAVFRNVTGNPRAEEVMEGAQFFLAEKCNGILAVGGGSPMDCAKGIGIVSSAPERSILEYEGVDEVKLPTPPLICVPTTAGTAADISQFSIITDLARSVKIAIISKAIVPDAALVDPVTTTSMDPYLTACTAIDALCHGVESYVSTAHSPITDIHALEAVRLIRRNLLPVIENPQDLLLRSKMMLASHEAGLAFSNASLGAVHAMAHSIGGLLDLSHGEANALLLGPVARYNFEYAPDRYRRLAEAFDVPTEGMTATEVRDALVDALNSFVRDAGVTQSLGTLGMTPAHIPELARKAMLDPCFATNPRTPTQPEVEAIYESAL